MTSDNDKLAKNVKPVVSCYQDECFKASSGVFYTFIVHAFQLGM